jgi:uncharacterized protein
MRPIRHVSLVSLLFCPALLGAVSSADAQSWCRHAARADEKLICNDAQLRQLDDRLNLVFGRRHRDISGRAKSKLDQEELGWLMSRHRCGADYRCLERRYIDRIEALSGSAAAAPDERKQATEMGSSRPEERFPSERSRKAATLSTGGRITEQAGTRSARSRAPAQTGSSGWINPSPGP